MSGTRVNADRARQRFAEILMCGFNRNALTAADQNPCRKNKRASEDNLKRSPEEGRFHKPVLNPGNGPQLDEDHDYGNDRRGLEIRDQIRQGVSQTANGGHDT